MEYIAPIYKNTAEAKNFPVAAINSFHWEEEGFSRPESYAALFAVENEGIHAVMWSFEDNIRCECTKRDDPVYTDSCLEFFIAPVEGDARYMNFEVNPKGVYLSQIGEKRENRRFIKELTDLEPVITTMSIEENGRTAWGYEIMIPCSFIAELYGTDFRIGEFRMRGNFYKCGDRSATPHYGAHFPVSSASLGFHNPDCFGDIIFRKA
ncbi:MAG: carbohydrate-binding family 9-like protein [Clostridia bacterium]|nr:carbohydrate-binding family 9-like protein [Clostridia bacterium]